MAYDITSAQRDAIRAHLRKDAVLRPLIDEFELPEHRVHLGPLYPTLLRAIVGQQVSVQAAASIYARFVALFASDTDGEPLVPPPEVLAKAEEDVLRSAGLSRGKARYVVALAEYFRDHPAAETTLRLLPNEELIAELTQIKGIGKWTAEMMLMFALGRLDVLPLDDLAISQSIVELYQLDTTGRALKVEQRNIAEAWQPYRSVACLYLYAYRGQRKHAGKDKQLPV